MRWFILAIALIVPCLASAQTVQTKSLVSSGGVHSSAGSISMSSNLGDILAGYSLAGSQEIWHGFYAPPIFQTTDVDGAPSVTFVTFLGRISPNPARTTAIVAFGNAIRQPLTIGVYDVSGRQVRTLYSGSPHAGVFQIPWNLRSDNGTPLPTGMYFLRLQAGQYRQVGRVIVVR